MTKKELTEITEITDETLGLTFQLPNRPTVRQMLEYEGAVGLSAGSDMYLRFWRAAPRVIVPDSWKCKLVELDTDLDDIHDPQAAEVIKYVALVLVSHMAKVKSGALTKN